MKALRKCDSEKRRFKDYFSYNSAAYSRHRPGYPDSLFVYLSSICPSHKMAWDCATGSGQSAQQLSQYFDTVIATDASESQVSCAQKKDNVHYFVATAENSAIGNNRLDLITIAQALHWFDLPAFSIEIERTLKQGGILAAWSYNLLTVQADIDEQVNHLYSTILNQYWPAERAIVEEGYQSVSFSFEELLIPGFKMTIEWTFEQLISYLSTWSAVNAYITSNNQNPVDLIYPELLQNWGNIDKERTVAWPLTVRVWQKS